MSGAGWTALAAAEVLRGVPDTLTGIDATGTIEQVSAELHYTKAQADAILEDFLAGGDRSAGGVLHAVTSAAQFDKLVKDLDRSRAAVLLVQRGEAAQFVPIRPEKG